MNRAPEPTPEDVLRASKASAREVYDGSDGRLTVAYYRRLQERGPIGQVAMNLFRSQKTSARAKAYRGRQYRQASYSVKNYSIEQLVWALQACPEIKWGWKEDKAMVAKGDPHDQILYIDLPSGQCSFHSSQRLQGPDYHGEWDGQHRSEERILTFCDSVASGNPVREITYIGPTSKAEAKEQPSGAIVCRRGTKDDRLEKELKRGGGRLVL